MTSLMIDQSEDIRNKLIRVVNNFGSIYSESFDWGKIKNNAVDYLITFEYDPDFIDKNDGSINCKTIFHKWDIDYEEKTDELEKKAIEQAIYEQRVSIVFSDSFWDIFIEKRELDETKPGQFISYSYHSKN